MLCQADARLPPEKLAPLMEVARRGAATAAAAMRKTLLEHMDKMAKAAADAEATQTV